jgi:hypothetical protein
LDFFLAVYGHLASTLLNDLNLIFVQTLQVILLKTSTSVNYVNAEQPTLVNRMNKEALEELMQVDLLFFFYVVLLSYIFLYHQGYELTNPMKIRFIVLITTLIETHMQTKINQP